MSFSGEVKEELSHITGHGRHCQIAELAALILFSGQLIQRSPGQWTLAVRLRIGMFSENTLHY